MTSYPPERSFGGQRLDAIAKSLGVDPADAAIEIIKGGDASVTSYTMSQDDIQAFMAQPWTMTSSDGDRMVTGCGMRRSAASWLSHITARYPVSTPRWPTFRRQG